MVCPHCLAANAQLVPVHNKVATRVLQNNISSHSVRLNCRRQCMHHGNDGDQIETGTSTKWAWAMTCAAVYRALTKTRPATVALTQAMWSLQMEGRKGLPISGYGTFPIYPPITINNTMGWYGLSNDNSYHPSTHTHTHVSMAGFSVPRDLLIPCSPGSAAPLLQGSPVFTLQRCPGQH